MEPRQRTPQSRKLFGVLYFFLLTGIVLGMWGLQLTLFYLDLMIWGERAEGVVVALKQTGDPQRRTRPYYPIVKYETLNGETVTFRYRAGHYPPIHAIGEEVYVLYFPEAPEEAVIDHGWLKWVGVAPLLLGGWGLVWACLQGLRNARRRMRGPHPPETGNGR